MKFSFAVFLSSLLVRASQGLHGDDAGVLDFKIATPGHSVTRVIESTVGGDLVLTTDASPEVSKTSCYVGSRRVDDGSLVWRRNVCSERPQEQQQHAFGMSTDTETWVSMDHAGIIRSWTSKEGTLLWDASVTPPIDGTPPRVWSLSSDYVAAASNDELSIFKADTGLVFDTIAAAAALKPHYKLENNETLQWLALTMQGQQVQGVLGFVRPDGTTTGNRMVLVSFQIGDDRFTSTKSLNFKSPVVAGSVELQPVGAVGSVHGIARSQTGAVHFSLPDGHISSEIPASTWHPAWESVVSVKPTSNPSVISVQGLSENGSSSMGLFRFDEATSNGWEQLYGFEEESPSTNFAAASYCAEAGIVVAMGMDVDGLKAYRHDSLTGATDGAPHDRLSPLTPLAIDGDLFVPDGDVLESIESLACSKSSMTTLMSTVGGTTTQLTFDISESGSVSAKVGWTAEEGFASISSAIVLDGSHLGSDDFVEEQETLADKLSFSSRISSQMEGITSIFSGAMGAFSRRDHIFGFVKVACLLSKVNGRIWGIATSGADRGAVQWSLDLPRSADWHTMVHGTTNSAQAIHGINGGTHTREILVLSASSSKVDWKCIDGTNGAIHSQSQVDIASPVIQVVPVYGSAGACRQASLLLHEDRTFSVVPADPATVALVQEQVKKAPNGMYTHYIDKASNKVESYQVAASASGNLTPLQVGRTSFQGEKIVTVTYPIRDEVVQTMSNILGDNSLLLKYINPHMAVVVTVAEEDGLASKTALAASIEKTNGEPSQTRKPAGAGADAAAEAKVEETAPNLFVNLVDTVSGRVLHRASHANADSSRDVVVLLSENWILYSFANAKTRRTELGVLTLHEGMIDSKGIGPFTSPDQSTAFSSFDARESKPVVLSKTYTFPKYITALGVTATKGGISSRNILVASDDGKITWIGRKMLETRRPMGKVKDVEKKEGLYPYSELVWQLPAASLTYNQTIEEVQSLLSAPTALESQALVLAFGGPDLFVTRTSPSKGFDLLPDSFSRELVSIVSVGIVVVLFVVRNMGSKKMLKNGWQ